MKKIIRKAGSVILTAFIAAASLTAPTSAANICFGGSCFNIPLPSEINCSDGSCGADPCIIRIGGKCITLPINLSTCSGGSCDTSDNCTGKTADKTKTTDKTPAKDSGSVKTGVDTAPNAADSAVTEVLALVNKARSENGLSALKLDADLCKLADIRAKEIVTSFSHTRPNGSSCFTVFKENGVSFRNAGENLAYGQKTAAAVMNAWMNSSGHRANILGKNFGKIGISCYVSGGVKYWTQIFMNA